MKGVILAGGLATRLRPLTLVTNKHLLPIYKKPMIYYPLEAIAKAGVRDVLLTSSPDHCGDFATLLENGKDFDLNLYFAVQNNATGGIAEAINLAKEFANNETILVLLGDGIFNYNLAPVVKKFEEQKEGAVVFGLRMPTDSGQYGVIEMDAKGKVISIEEKPQHPKSDIVQTGVYMYDAQVFDLIKSLVPSERNQLEVTDLNNKYLDKGLLTCELLDWWIDAGTSHDELLRANNLVKAKYDKGELT